jgi:hypothetical protein
MCCVVSREKLNCNTGCNGGDCFWEVEALNHEKKNENENEMNE